MNAACSLLLLFVMAEAVAEAEAVADQSAQKQGRRAWSLISTFTLNTTIDN